MTYNNYIKVTKNDGLLMISSILITRFLVFIDQGSYSFKSMGSIDTWIFMIFYGLPIFLGQLLIFNIALKEYKGVIKILVSILWGAILGVMVVFGLIYIMRYIQITFYPEATTLIQSILNNLT